MPLVISDEILHAAKLTEEDARIEFACAMFQARRLSLHSAAQVANLDRMQMEEQLFKRNIAVYRPTVEEVQKELRALDRLGI